MIKITVDGIEKTSKNLDARYQEMLNEFREVVEETTKQVTQRASSNAPKRTGGLAGSMKSRKISAKEKGDKGIYRTVAARKKASFRRVPNGPQVNRGGTHRHLLELGTRNGVPAHKFMEKAAREAKANHDQRIRAVAEKRREF
jgi:HK97 gp10 family phage protein